MEVDQDIEFLGPRKEGLVCFVVVENALVLIVDQGADKTELLNTACQFVGRGCWIRYRDRRPTPEAGWMPIDGCSQNVVGILTFREIDDSVSNGDESGAYYGSERYALQINSRKTHLKRASYFIFLVTHENSLFSDSSLVHFLKPKTAQVRQFLKDIGRLAGIMQGDLCCYEVLLHSDEWW